MFLSLLIFNREDDLFSEVDVDDTDLRPLSENELRERVMKTAEKRIMYGSTSPTGQKVQVGKKDARKKKVAGKS